MIVVAAAALDLHAALGVLEIFIPVGIATGLAARTVVGRGLGRGAGLGRLRRQFTLIALIAVLEMALTLGLSVKLMFVSYHDAVWAVLVMSWTALLAFGISCPLARDALSDLEAIRGALAKVGDGGRDIRISVAGGGELAGVARDLEAMVAKLDAEETARRRLLAAVSHDLRTPITSLQLVTDAIQDDLIDGRAKSAYLNRLGTHVRALSALIDDLFELSRLEAGEINWTRERVSIEALVQETVEAMRPQADAGAVQVRVQVEPGVSAARANPERLQRVLFNLIQNAIRHTPADGSVVVRAEAGLRDIELEVADNGEGIAAEDRGRIFEPFVQGSDRAARTDGSAGLGLAIARAIVEAHGGRIWLEDADLGTRVRFTVPAAA
jgi:signal transduction histidine kinase